MHESEIRALISATAPKMPGPDPDRREVLKQQAEQLARNQAMNVRPPAAPPIPAEIEQGYIAGQILLYELRKRKRAEGF